MPGLRASKTISRKLTVAQASQAARVLQTETERRLYDQRDIERSSLPHQVGLRMCGSCSLEPWRKKGKFLGC